MNRTQAIKTLRHTGELNITGNNGDNIHLEADNGKLFFAINSPDGSGGGGQTRWQGPLNSIRNNFKR